MKIVLEVWDEETQTWQDAGPYEHDRYLKIRTTARLVFISEE